MSKVQWAQFTWDGVDVIMKFLGYEKSYPEATLSRLAVFGRHMAEYVLGHIITFERNFKGIIRDQERQ